MKKGEESQQSLWLVGQAAPEHEPLLDELSHFSYAVDQYKNLSEALQRLSSNPPEGILIDADQMEIPCIEFCHQVKSMRKNKTVLIVMSSNVSESMEVSVFDAGADEFVQKPVKTKAFIRRIAARLTPMLDSYSILYKENGKSALQIDKESFSVYLNQNLIPLSRKEFELLHLMASQPGKVFTREEIFSKIWKRLPSAKERTIDVHILRLRKKLGEEFITTQKGVGYRFCA